jgi:uncharacterized protein (UPF0332 family)
MKEGKLKLVEPSDEIKESYLEKANNCLKSAKILFPNNLYENVVIDTYYAMYNSLLALLFKTGIKSENHTGSILILNEIFGEQDLSNIILEAKEERIDQQYYIDSTKNKELTKDFAEKSISITENFLIKIKIIIESLSNEDIKKIRLNFNKISNQD